MFFWRIIEEFVTRLDTTLNTSYGVRLEALESLSRRFWYVHDIFLSLFWRKFDETYVEEGDEVDD